MRPRRERGFTAVLVAAIVAIAVGGTAAAATDGAASASAGAAEAGAVRGKPWTGERGIRETVAEIQRRGRASADRPKGPPRQAPRPGERRRPAPAPGAPTPGPSEPDAGRVASATAPAPSTGESFLAGQLSDGPFAAYPPDTMGAVGLTQVMVTLNNRIKVFDKNGVLGGLNVSIDAFFASVREGTDAFDPQVEYDRLANRWIVAAINDGPGPGDTNNRIMLAVSSGPTITDSSSFTFFQFRHNEVTPAGDTNRFADYPQMGVDQNAVYIGVNNFSIPGAYVNSAGYVIRKSSVLGAGPIVVTAFRGIQGGTGGGPFAPQGVQNMTPGAPAGYFVGVNNEFFGQLALRRVTNPGGTPSISSNLQVPVPTGTNFPLDVPADGSLRPLDAIDDRLFGATINVDEGGTPGLWTAHNVRTNAAGAAGTTGSHNRTSSRWYEIGSLAGAPSLVQSGTLFDSAVSNPNFFWMPTIAENGQGVATLGSSISAANTFAGAAAAQRLPTDPLGTLGPHSVIQAGLAAYNDPLAMENPGFQRWGDYSATVVDPTDNQTFWTFQEYVNGADNWAVQAVEINAPPPATPAAANPPVVNPQASVLVEITGAQVDGSAFFDPGLGFPNHIDATVSGGVTVNGVVYNDPTHVILDLNTSTAPAGTKDVTITNPDGQLASATDVIEVGADTTPPETTITDGPANGSTISDPTPTFEFTSNEPGSTFECSVDGAAPTPCDSPFTTPALNEGSHSFSVAAIDQASNTDPSPDSRSFTVDTAEPPDTTPPDTTPPETTITKKPKRKIRTRKRKVRVAFKFVSSEPGSTFECKLKGKGVRKKLRGWRDCESPRRYKVKAKAKARRYVFRVRASDPAGNTDPTPAKRKWKVKRR